MRSLARLLSVAIVCVFASAQRPPAHRPSFGALAAEQATRQATEAFGRERKIYERDLEVLRHLRLASAALTDPMQPGVSVQTAFEEVDEALRLDPEFLVRQGVIRMKSELESARKSPASADFERLRALLDREAAGPASRVVARNALAMETETLAWIKAQGLINEHLRTLSQTAAESLTAATQ